ncbi:MAG TPA: type II toxin-antitoxin system HicA family toxin [Allosphingosinicella sp.]|nr:type II toxin-antitoxin system HicA family toxin [Allosphingosinicella sp.]
MGKRGEKLLDRMRRNPADWRIDDVRTLCESFGLDLDRRPNGSHYGISDVSQAAHVTIPFARPINRVYIRQLVRFVDAVRVAREKIE